MGGITSTPTSQKQLEHIMSQVRNYDGKTKTFVHIMDQVHKLKCESALGESFQLWKLACLYSNTALRNNDLGPSSADIIAKFMEEQSRIKNMPKGPERDQLLNYLYYGTHDQSYLKSF